MSAMLHHSLAALILAGTAAPVDPAGAYRLVEQREVASEIVLQPDGRFRYYLSTGALDEQAEGRWARAGERVTLTTEPEPVPPAFTPRPPGKTTEAALSVRVVGPDGRGIPGVDFVIGFDSGPSIEHYTQEYGWSYSPKDERKPLWIRLAVPMHAVLSPPFPIDLAAGNALVFTFTPNDFGIADFDALPLDIEPGRLLMRRHGATLVYERSK